MVLHAAPTAVAEDRILNSQEIKDIQRNPIPHPREWVKGMSLQETSPELTLSGEVWGFSVPYLRENRPLKTKDCYDALTLLLMVANYDLIKWKHFHCNCLAGNPPVTHGLPAQRGSDMDLWCFFVEIWTKCWPVIRLTGHSRHHDGHLTLPWRMSYDNLQCHQWW